MKKLLLALFVLLPLCGWGQYYSTEVGTGVAVAGWGARPAPGNKVLWLTSVSLCGVQIDYATNFARGAGQEIYGLSPEHPADKTNISMVVIGMNFNLNDRLILMPKFGVVQIDDIYDLPDGMGHWTQSRELDYLFGAALKYYFKPNLGFSISTAYCQPISFQLLFRF